VPPSSLAAVEGSVRSTASATTSTCGTYTKHRFKSRIEQREKHCQPVTLPVLPVLLHKKKFKSGVESSVINAVTATTGSTSTKYRYESRE
jgi:hypothetical protein